METPSIPKHTTCSKIYFSIKPPYVMKVVKITILNSTTISPSIHSSVNKIGNIFQPTNTKL